MSNIPTAKVCFYNSKKALLVEIINAILPLQLNSGYEFPLIGYGTFGGHNGHEEVYNATKTALQVGYRHFDTAFLCKYTLFNCNEGNSDALSIAGLHQTKLKRLQENPLSRVKCLVKNCSSQRSCGTPFTNLSTQAPPWIFL